jgi:sulfide:quinone oxidoreductase
MRVSTDNKQPFKVLIAGGGVAGLEAALALRDLAGERVAMMMLAPEAEFVYRPMQVLEPFAYQTARHFSLAQIADDLGVELMQDALKAVDPVHRMAHTEGGHWLSYDALLLALGAIARPRFDHAVTLDDRRLDEQLHGLIQDIEGGYVHKLAFLVPTRMPWPVPVYELALLTARRAWSMGADLSITLVTPEDAPLAIFGSRVSEAVEQLLEEQGILVIHSAHAEVPEPGQIAIYPGSRRLQVERIVALPELQGPPIAGVPSSADGGFIPVDVHGRVAGIERVYAAGDATAFAVKHGGIAAQQADAAAEAIAALAGAAVEPQPFHPVIRTILLGAEKPLYLSAHITGGHGSTSQASEEPTWAPHTKIAAKYLGPYLESLDCAALR